MKDNGKIINKMDMESKNGLMDQYILVFGLTVKKTGKES